MEPHSNAPDRTRLYVVTFVILGVMTFIEFAIGGIPFVPGLEPGLFAIIGLPLLKLPALILFATGKAVLVAGVYMHLRFDSPAFRNLLLAGLLCALLLIGAFTFVLNINWAT
ncbi:MAG: cytochrome C oxidase subunit IV family protein [Chloroflexi bacterium]|nr:cytochrome C oxidase subunit IV family protein [Chloroflexota bacterium]